MDVKWTTYERCDRETIRRLQSHVIVATWQFVCDDIYSCRSRGVYCSGGACFAVSKLLQAWEVI